MLPILGAIPDCAIIVASGIGSDAQEKLSIGMGLVLECSTDYKSATPSEPHMASVNDWRFLVKVTY